MFVKQNTEHLIIISDLARIIKLSQQIIGDLTHD